MLHRAHRITGELILHNWCCATRKLVPVFAESQLYWSTVSLIHFCRKFQEKQLSTALGNARPEHLSDRTAMLKIDTSIASAAGSLLVNTAQVHIRIYRAAPSLAESMSGSFARNKAQSSIGMPAVNPKLLWQSAQLSKDSEAAIFVDMECSAKAVDAACEGTALCKTHVQQQVLQFLQQKQDIKLASKTAKVRVLSNLIVPCAMCQQSAYSPLLVSTCRGHVACVCLRCGGCKCCAL